MSYAIVINLDYESNPEELCQGIWDRIKQAMLQGGFRMDNRVFMINRDEKVATKLARNIIEKLDEASNSEVVRYIKCFYGYDMAHTSNLLVPSSDEIEVDES